MPAWVGSHPRGRHGTARLTSNRKEAQAEFLMLPLHECFPSLDGAQDRCVVSMGPALALSKPCTCTPATPWAEGHPADGRAVQRCWCCATTLLGLMSRQHFTCREHTGVSRGNKGAVARLTPAARMVAVS